MEIAVVTVLGLVGLLAVVAALLRDTEVEQATPPRPDWDPLPSPSDLARADFGLRVPGYDPVTVEIAFEQLADAYADLLAEADAPTIARARRRAEARLARDRPAGRARSGAGHPAPDGVLTETAATGSDRGDVLAPPQGALGSSGAGDPTRDALRAEAALDALRRDDSTR